MKRDDWEAYEHACEVLADIRARLKTGGSVTLTADECALLLVNLQAPAPPKYRPADLALSQEKIFAALFSIQLERDGMLKKAAVAATAAKFGCSKWIVNKARRNMLKK